DQRRATLGRATRVAVAAARPRERRPARGRRRRRDERLGRGRRPARHARARRGGGRRAREQAGTDGRPGGAPGGPGGAAALMPVPLVTRILVADDHEIVRRGVRLVMDREPDLDVVAEAADGREAVELALSPDVDLAILDVSMPRMTGLQAAR